MEPSSGPGSVVLLTRLARVVYRKSNEELLGIRLKNLMALAYLRDHREATQQVFSEAMHLDANNCVLLLNELDDHGFVERKRDPQDRRRHIVVITPAGGKALAKAEAKLEELEGEVLRNLDAAEREQLRDLLARAMDGQDPNFVCDE
jgi:MarR family transcriptional regulator, temperature-dependent positive regulator of motility